LIWAVYGSRPPISSSPAARCGLDNITCQQWSDATCLLNLFKCLLSLCHARFAWKDKAKSWKRWYRGKFRQTMVDSRYCLNWFVPGCEATRGQEPGHKLCTLENPSVCGQLHEVPCWRGTKNELRLDMVSVHSEKGLENWSLTVEPNISLISKGFRSAQIHEESMNSGFMRGVVNSLRQPQIWVGEPLILKNSGRWEETGIEEQRLLGRRNWLDAIVHQTAGIKFVEGKPMHCLLLPSHVGPNYSTSPRRSKQTPPLGEGSLFGWFPHDIWEPPKKETSPRGGIFCDQSRKERPQTVYWVCVLFVYDNHHIGLPSQYIKNAYKWSTLALRCSADVPTDSNGTLAIEWWSWHLFFNRLSGENMIATFLPQCAPIGDAMHSVALNKIDPSYMVCVRHLDLCQHSSDSPLIWPLSFYVDGFSRKGRGFQ